MRVAVTVRDGTAELDVPFGFVAVGVGGRVQDDWVAADGVAEFTFRVRRRDVRPADGPG